MKRKVHLFLMAMLLPLLNVNAQSNSFSCGTDSLFAKALQDNPSLVYLKNSIKQNAKLYRQHNPNIQLPPKPMPPPSCDMCMTIETDPGCFKARYILPVIVHIVHYEAYSIKGVGSNISDTQVYQAIRTLNQRFAGYGLMNHKQ